MGGVRLGPTSSGGGSQSPAQYTGYLHPSGRDWDTYYQNDTGSPMIVVVSIQDDTGTSGRLAARIEARPQGTAQTWYLDRVELPEAGGFAAKITLTALVPDGWEYRVTEQSPTTTEPAVTGWYEGTV